jgi:hypothetical protein
MVFTKGSGGKGNFGGKKAAPFASAKGKPGAKVKRKARSTKTAKGTMKKGK